jgi:group I intron endonuclease
MYIGYTSRPIERRFYEHKFNAYSSTYEEDKSALYSSMRKYGTNNFTIDTIIDFDEFEYDWQELEKYYIKEYNTLVPNGYNILEGGDMPPIHYGDENHQTKIKDRDLPKVFEMLKDTSISYNDIAKYFNVSVSQIYMINTGKNRH